MIRWALTLALVRCNVAIEKRRVILCRVVPIVKPCPNRGLTMPEIGTHFGCNICGENFLVEKLYSEVCGVCGPCAENVANAYSMAHGGSWLTLPNEGTKKIKRQPIDQSLRWSVFRDDNFTCKQCGETHKPLHLDHIIAIRNGGGGDRSNLQTLCETCNTSKGAK